LLWKSSLSSEIERYIAETEREGKEEGRERRGEKRKVTVYQGT
jgi:hypothetical protein